MTKHRFTASRDFLSHFLSVGLSIALSVSAGTGLACSSQSYSSEAQGEPSSIRSTTFPLRSYALTAAQKAALGKKLLDIYKDESATASHLEYSRMYLLRPFAVDVSWNSEDQYVKLFNDAPDEFARREILLAMGRAKQAFWFRSRKQNLHEMTPWIRRAFIYGASCLPSEEFKHWIRGIDGQLDVVERAVAHWARGHPIG